MVSPCSRIVGHFSGLVLLPVQTIVAATCLRPSGAALAQ
jgi:hypothetical protein